MIKLFALLTMLIDHVGLIFFPDVRWIRYIGRLAMPLYGYCIARGFYYSKEHGTLLNYAKNLVILTIVSEIPYTIMEQRPAIDIGLTWLFSLAILYVLESDKEKLKRYVGAAIILIFAAGLYHFISFDFGIYGVMTAVCMYYLMIKKNEPYSMFLALVILWAFYVLVMRKPFEQFFAVFAIILISALLPHDGTIKLPKRLYYWFYPVHMTILLIIERMISK